MDNIFKLSNIGGAKFRYRYPNMLAGILPTAYGYLCGSQAYSTKIDKMTFSTETVAAITGVLVTGRFYGASFVDSSVAGYNAGGIPSAGTGSPSNTIDKITFSTDAVSSVTTLSLGVYGPAGFCNSTVAGYSAGGYNAGFQSFVDKITLSSATRTTLGTGLTGVAYQAGSFANDGVVGYVGGGDIGDYSNNFNQWVDKFSFPSDTKSSLSAWLSNRRSQIGSFKNKNISGYFVGGWEANSAYPSPGAAVNTVDKMTFATETRSTTSGALTSGLYTDGFHYAGVNGYIMYGTFSSSQRYPFATETWSAMQIQTSDNRTLPMCFGSV